MDFPSYRLFIEVQAVPYPPFSACNFCYSRRDGTIPSSKIVYLETRFLKARYKVSFSFRIAALLAAYPLLKGKKDHLGT